MNVLEEFVSVRAPLASVERHLADLSLRRQWNSTLIALEPLEGEWMAPGSTHRRRLLTLALFGSLSEATYTVVGRDNGHILQSIDGAWKGMELWRWFEDGGRTIIQNRVEYEIPNPTLRVFVTGIGGFLADVDLRLQLTRLRQMLEGHGQIGGTQSIKIERGD